MERRGFLGMAVGALVGGRTAVEALISRGGGSDRQSSAASTGSANGTTLKVDSYSRYLQWLRTPEQVAAAVHELGFNGLDITVRPYPGHVDPARVKQDLPPFVKAIRNAGIEVTTIAAPIVDADSPHAEDILTTASGLGVRNYWGGIFRYDLAKPIVPQLEAIKPRIAKLAELNRKYDMTAMYHTYTFPGAVGCALWDLWYVLRDSDPEQVGIHYDTSHMVNAQILGGWETSLRAAGQYIRGLSIKDSYIEKGPNPPPPGRAAAPARVPPPGVFDVPWHERYTPLGEGSVPVEQVLKILTDIGFSGPVEIQVEYPDGGADQGLDKITLPRDQVLAPIKKDLAYLRSAAQKAGFNPRSAK